MKNLKVAIITFMCFLFLSQLDAQNQFYQIENRWKSTMINNESKSLDLSMIQQGWHSAQFILEPVTGTSYVRIKNRYKGTYLNNQVGALQMTSIEKGWWSAMWTIEPVAGSKYVRLKNRWKGTYINNQKGAITAGTIEKGWWSAMWMLKTVDQNGSLVSTKTSRISFPGTLGSMTVAELKSDLRSQNLTLVQTNTLKENQCTVVYANGDAADIKAELGLLMCVTKVHDKVTLTQAVVHGGCDASNPITQGAGAKCEIGVLKQNLKVDIPGGEVNYNVKGPSAETCSAVSTEMVCFSAGATLASTSFEVTDDRGNGVGIGVSAGVGYGVDAGYEDGVISAAVDLKIIAGASLTISLNVEDVKAGVVQVGETGYLLVKNEVVAAAGPVKRFFKNDVKNTVVDAKNLTFGFVENNGKVVVKGINDGVKETGDFFVGAVAIVGSTVEKTATDVSRGLGLSTHPNEFEVTIDACHEDIDSDDSETNNKVTCVFYAGTKKVKEIAKNGIDANCITADESYKFTTREKITHIVLTTSGDDALFIDELKLYKGGDLVQHHGRDDGSGWALSTDSNDKFSVGPYSARSHRFNY